MPSIGKIVEVTAAASTLAAVAGAGQRELERLACAATADSERNRARVVEVVRFRERKAVALRRQLAQAHETIGVRKRQRLKHRGVDHAEGGGRAADADRQRQRRRRAVKPRRRVSAGGSRNECPAAPSPCASPAALNITLVPRLQAVVLTAVNHASRRCSATVRNRTVRSPETVSAISGPWSRLRPGSALGRRRVFGGVERQRRGRDGRLGEAGGQLEAERVRQLFDLRQIGRCR